MNSIGFHPGFSPSPGPRTRCEAFDVCLFTGYYGVKMAAQLGFVLVYQAGGGVWGLVGGDIPVMYVNIYIYILYTDR